MSTEIEKNALIKTICLQRRMIEDFRTLHNTARRTLEVLCGLDPAFQHAYFSRVLAYEPEGLPGSIPDRETLLKALEALGWTPERTSENAWFSALHNHQPNPWKEFVHTYPPAGLPNTVSGA